MPRRDYRFVPVTRDDLPMLHRWLTAPHVAAIWGDPDDEIALIEGDLEGSDTRCHIVHADGPIGYVQDWCPHRAGVPHFADAPAGSRAVDTFLGETGCLGQGHARAYVRCYAERLIARGAPRAVTDPRLDNPRGIAMYRAAGFAPGPVRIAEDGARVRCMTFTPSLAG